MHKNQEGFSVVEGLLIVIVVIFIGFVGWYLGSSSNKKDATSATKIQTKAKDTKSSVDDKALIITAVKADNAAQSPSLNLSNVTVTSIVGDNAKGSTYSSEDESGYTFISHKTNGDWKIVFKGQEDPGKDLGKKYSLPAGWYSTDY